MSVQSVMPVLPASADAGTETSPGELGAGCGRAWHQVGLGALTGEISPGLVEEVIEAAGCREKRQRLLPARVVVYFVLGLCLFSGADSMAPRGTLVTLGVDVVLPVVLYYSLHSAGFSSIVALVAGAAVPALGAAVKLIKNRQLDMLAVLVVASVALSIALSFASGSPRFLLAKDGWITGAWGAWMLVGARATRPPTYVIARRLMEGRRMFGTASWEKLWERSPDFRRMWRVTTVMWGLALLADAGIRTLMAYALPVSVVPGLAGALYPVTVLVLQVVTNVYFHRAGLYRMLGARRASPT